MDGDVQEKPRSGHYGTSIHEAQESKYQTCDTIYSLHIANVTKIPISTHPLRPQNSRLQMRIDRRRKKNYKWHSLYQSRTNPRRHRAQVRSPVKLHQHHRRERQGRLDRQHRYSRSHKGRPRPRSREYEHCSTSNHPSQESCSSKKEISLPSWSLYIRTGGRDL